MNHTLSSTIGIDTVIQSVQSELYGLLDLRWEGTINGYGRVQKNKQVPQWYAGGSEYEPVYYNDNVSGNFFFIEGESHPTEDEVIFTSEVKVAFMVNLNQIQPLETGRADSKVQRDAVEFLRRISDERFTITGLEKTVGKVFSGFDTSQIQFEDYHPTHCFAVVLKLSYYITDEC